VAGGVGDALAQAEVHGRQRRHALRLDAVRLGGAQVVGDDHAVGGGHDAALDVRQAGAQAT
jgi:hypothetical protein